MAEILLRHSRGINVICRYGGDEFAVLLVETSKAGARLYADRIRYVLSSYQFAHGRPRDGELRHRLAARGRGAHRRRSDPRRRRGAVRGQARRQEPRVSPRGRRRGAARGFRGQGRMSEPSVPQAGAHRRGRRQGPARAARGLRHRRLPVPRGGQRARGAGRASSGERPPLTLTDIKMPVMDGLEFLSQRARHRRRRGRSSSSPAWAT